MREGVVRNDQNADVDDAVGERVTEVADIHDEQIAAPGHLNLDT